MDLRQVALGDLIRELQSRDGIRSMSVQRDEVYKAQAAGTDDSKNRYIKGEGPAVILEVKRGN